MELSIDGLCSGLIGMFLSGGTQAGGSIVNAARTNTSTPVPTASQADYTPYLEQLKQAQWNRKVRDLQNAYQEFLRSDEGNLQQNLKDKQREETVDKGTERSEKNNEGITKKLLEDEEKNSTMYIGLQFFANKSIKKQSDVQLTKSISSWEKNIQTHQNKILHPEEYDQGWGAKTDIQKQGLINHWKKEIKYFEQNINEAREELKGRGKSGEQ